MIKHKLNCRVVIAAFAIALTVATSTPGIADERPANQQINGIFHVSDQDCSDGGTKTCFFYAEIFDEAAKALYDNMRSVAKPDMCTGGFTKTDNDALHCFNVDNRRYQCYLGYDFTTTEIVIGDFSC